MNGTNYEVPHCGAFSTPHSHPSWAQIFTSGSCFQISLAWIPPLMWETMFLNHIAQLAILSMSFIARKKYTFCLNSYGWFRADRFVRSFWDILALGQIKGLVGEWFSPILATQRPQRQCETWKSVCHASWNLLRIIIQVQTIHSKMKLAKYINFHYVTKGRSLPKPLNSLINKIPMRHWFSISILSVVD